jgi:hypothetical protein
VPRTTRKELRGSRGGFGTLATVGMSSISGSPSTGNPFTHNASGTDADGIAARINGSSTSLAATFSAEASLQRATSMPADVPPGSRIAMRPAAPLANTTPFS